MIYIQGNSPAAEWQSRHSPAQASAALAAAAGLTNGHVQADPRSLAVPHSCGVGLQGFINSSPNLPPGLVQVSYEFAYLKN